MNCIRLSVRLSLLALLSFLNISIKAQEIRDLIQPVHLTAGVTDTVFISDLFYAENYNADFSSDKNIEVRYNRPEGILVLTSDKNFEGFDLIDFQLNGNKYELPVISEIAQTYTFTYKPERNVKSVNLFGSFNGWNRQNLVMIEKDGIYSLTISLEPGRYEYKFLVDGSEILDPANPERISNGMGGFNSVLNIGSLHNGKKFLHVLGKVVNAKSITLSFYYGNENQTTRINYSNLIALLNNRKIPDNKINISGNRIDLTIDNVSSKKRGVVRLAVTKDAETTNMQTVYLFDDKPAGKEKNVTLQDQIIYSIMIDRFYDGDKKNDKPVIQKNLLKQANYQGGDFQGIIDKLNSGYFDSLGVNTLWISPVVDNPDSAYPEYPAPHRLYTGYHGYWPLHSSKVEEHFGTMNLLKKLISIAHKHKFKVIIDYVAHHVFIQNSLFKNHRDWFGVLDLPNGKKNLRLWDEYRLTTWFEPYLPTFDYLDSKDARDAMTDNALWWLKETNADGFRHDAVKHIPNVFWRLLTKKIETEIEIPKHKTIYQIGETFGSYQLVSSYVNTGQLNAQFNFNLYDVAIPTFVKPGATFETLDNELHKSFSVYGVNNLMGNIMDSHDKVRFMSFADGEISLDAGNASEIGWTDPPIVKHKSSYEKLKLYLSYLLTIPGVPVIDYGDEIGMTGAADPDNRRMMRFGNQLNDWEKETLKDVRKIIKIRDNNSALRYGDFLTMQADTNCYVYLRSDMNERVLIALNKSNKSENLKINLPAFYRLSKATDLFNSKEIELKSNLLETTIPATGFKIIKLN